MDKSRISNWYFSSSVIFYNIVISFQIITTVYCVGNSQIAIKYISFDNPNGTLADGRCCDDLQKSAGYCPPDLCDTTFIPCGTTVRRCDTYPEQGIPVMYNNNSFEFGKKLGNGENTSFNLVSIKFPYTGKNVSFTVVAREISPGHIRHVAQFSFIVDWVDPYHTGSKPKYVRYSLKDDNVELVLDIVSQCVKRFFNEDCSVYCRSLKDHSYCLDNGTKMCYYGWEGNDCTDMIDFCSGHRCQHGSTCVPKLANYTCACPPGYTGFYCQTLVPTSTVTTSLDTTPSSSGSASVSGQQTTDPSVPKSSASLPPIPTLQPATPQTSSSTVPTLTTSSSTVPTLTTSSSTVPTLTTSSSTVPTLTTSSSTVPTLTTSTSAVPTLTTSSSTVPALTTSTSTVPTLTTSTSAAPTLTTSTSTVPTLTTSSSTVPTLTTSSSTVPTLTTSTSTVPTQTTSYSAAPIPTSSLASIPATASSRPPIVTTTSTHTVQTSSSAPPVPTTSSSPSTTISAPTTWVSVMVSTSNAGQYSTNTPKHTPDSQKSKDSEDDTIFIALVAAGGVLLFLLLCLLTWYLCRKQARKKQVSPRDTKMQPVKSQKPIVGDGSPKETTHTPVEMDWSFDVSNEPGTFSHQKPPLATMFGREPSW